MAYYVIGTHKDAKEIGNSPTNISAGLLNLFIRLADLDLYGCVAIGDYEQDLWVLLKDILIKPSPKSNIPPRWFIIDPISEESKLSTARNFGFSVFSKSVNNTTYDSSETHFPTISGWYKELTPTLLSGDNALELHDNATIDTYNSKYGANAMQITKNINYEQFNYKTLFFRLSLNTSIPESEIDLTNYSYIKSYIKLSVGDDTLYDFIPIKGKYGMVICDNRKQDIDISAINWDAVKISEDGKMSIDIPWNLNLNDCINTKDKICTDRKGSKLVSQSQDFGNNSDVSDRCVRLICRYVDSHGLAKTSVSNPIQVKPPKVYTEEPPRYCRGIEEIKNLLKFNSISAETLTGDSGNVFKSSTWRIPENSITSITIQLNDWILTDSVGNPYSDSFFYGSNYTNDGLSGSDITLWRIEFKDGEYNRWLTYLPIGRGMSNVLISNDAYLNYCNSKVINKWYKRDYRYKLDISNITIEHTSPMQALVPSTSGNVTSYYYDNLIYNEGNVEQCYDNGKLLFKTYNSSTGKYTISDTTNATTLYLRRDVFNQSFKSGLRSEIYGGRFALKVSTPVEVEPVFFEHEMEFGSIAMLYSNNAWKYQTLFRTPIGDNCLISCTVGGALLPITLNTDLLNFTKTRYLSYKASLDSGVKDKVRNYNSLLLEELEVYIRKYSTESEWDQYNEYKISYINALNDDLYIKWSYNKKVEGLLNPEILKNKYYSYTEPSVTNFGKGTTCYIDVPHDAKRGYDLWFESDCNIYPNTLTVTKKSLVDIISTTYLDRISYVLNYMNDLALQCRLNGNFVDLDGICVMTNYRIQAPSPMEPGPILPDEPYTWDDSDDDSDDDDSEEMKLPKPVEVKPLEGPNVEPALDLNLTPVKNVEVEMYASTSNDTANSFNLGKSELTLESKQNLETYLNNLIKQSGFNGTLYVQGTAFYSQDSWGGNVDLASQRADYLNSFLSSWASTHGVTISGKVTGAVTETWGTTADSQRSFILRTSFNSSAFTE